MSSCKHDICVMCSKIVTNCYKIISCKICAGFVHTKCTKPNLRQLNRLNPKEWVCSNCSSNTLNSDSDIEEEEVNNI